MSTAYTPGPWRVIEANLLPYHGDHVADMSNGLMVVASNKLGDPLADARLISSAPELLEALRDMLAGWKYIRESHGDLYGVGWDRAQDKAVEVIAKATGVSA